MEEVERLEYQDQLIDTIMRVLVHQPDLHYYQVMLRLIKQGSIYRAVHSTPQSQEFQR